MDNETNNKMKNFTTENQKENNVTRTTTQTIKHFIYSNVEITICGWFNDSTNCKVWKKQGKKVSMVAEGLELTEAVELANKLIIS
tara:strand:- start:531 stop:785 length:255 start_codon:yes stop_codon:yes gene_type:complete